MESNISQGEIWLVNFDPSIGNEIQKTRPCVVINDDRLGRFGIKVVVPITEWKDYLSKYPWILKIENNSLNGLAKVSGIECFQVKSFSTERFVKKLGILDKNMVKKIHKLVIKVLNPAYELMEDFKL